MFSKYALALALAVAAPATAQSDALTNETVVQLVRAGLGDEAVIAKIRSSKGNFDTSTPQLIALRGQGVSGAVIAAMIGGPAPTAVAELSSDAINPAVAHYPGVYMVEATAGDGRMTRIMPTASNQAKTGGIFGYALTGGIASMSVKAAIPNADARVQTRNTRPVFYFYFDESVPRALQNAGMSTWTSGVGVVTSSPSELSLVRFMEKKGAREARIGSANIAGVKTGVMDKDRLAFDVEQVRPGVFKVTPSNPLPPGEYGFIQPLSSGGATGAAAARVFDFGIQ